ncbi:hypothetical protein [Cohnella candidum]|uniref:Uncharacterized protein n=1 Tax=Cohnella candidum TaxID=2674991 RepID=A0A3G3K0S5_9BACL|nr:hypothetical protein [Cohnella candidum]AYQ73359.1 hypothetical protein EAV92_12725 [Cohnella candidum]
MPYAFTLDPGEFFAFGTEAEQIDKCKEWGLLSEKAAKTKTFTYKGNNVHLSCHIVGYVDKMTAVIEFDNGQRHCVHPSYLKEMQASGFGQKTAASSEENSDPSGTSDTAEQSDVPTTPKDAEPAITPKSEQAEQAESASSSKPPKAETAPKPAVKKGKAAKVELPEDKVKMSATIKEFTTVPNHFSDTDDEVVIYEAVSIEEPQAELGDAWSSYSATLKKLELQVGDKIQFEAKVIAKKLTKHPVPYKINNPSKIQKEGS